MRPKDNPYEAIAADIVASAITDYRHLMRKYKALQALAKILKATNPKKYQKQCDYYINEMAKIDGFFRSDWFRVLTAIDPDVVIKKLEEEFNGEN